MKAETPYGMIGEFTKPEQVLEAARRAHAEGYRKLDAFTPFHVEGLAEAIGMRHTGIPPITLLCGMVGGLAGYGMQWYAATTDYPLNIGGRPLHSWPAFVPIAFELTVLFAAFGTVVGMLLLNGLPCPHHPVFDTPYFEERNQSHFYLCIEAADPLFEREATQVFFRKLHPTHIWEVPR